MGGINNIEISKCQKGMFAFMVLNQVMFAALAFLMFFVIPKVEETSTEEQTILVNFNLINLIIAGGFAVY